MSDEFKENEVAARTIPEPLLHWTGVLLNRSAQKVRDAVEGRMSGSGLKSKHVSALILLDHAPATQIELGRMLWVDRTSMVALVDELEASGDVRRERHPEDRRAYSLSLTEQGRETLGHGRRIADEVEAEIFSGLSSEEREQLRALLARLI